MARGKHKARAGKRREERNRQKLGVAQARLEQENARMEEAQAAAQVVTTLIAEIDELRAHVHAATSDEETTLQNGIRELLTELGRLRAEEMGNTQGQEHLLANGLFESGNTEWITAFLREVERRLVERYPDEYIEPPEELTVLRTIPRSVAEGMDMEAIRRIERARRSTPSVPPR